MGSTMDALLYREIIFVKPPNSLLQHPAYCPLPSSRSVAFYLIILMGSRTAKFKRAVVDMTVDKTFQSVSTSLWHPHHWPPETKHEKEASQPAQPLSRGVDI